MTAGHDLTDLITYLTKQYDDLREQSRDLEYKDHWSDEDRAWSSRTFWMTQQLTRWIKALKEMQATAT